MLTLRAAAGLLSQADSLRSLRAIARHLGFHTVRHLDRDGQRELDVDALVTDADLARGDGTRRCLLACLTPLADDESATDPRELTRRLGVALLRRAPARDWCVITLDHAQQIVCIAAVTPHLRGPSLAALRIDRRRVVDSDADTLRSLAEVESLAPDLRHARCAEILGRDALSNRFYRSLDAKVTLLADSADGHASATERRELALLCASRCLFLAFLEAKGWLAHDRQFLLSHTTHHLERGGKLHERLLRPLFFGTLNTPVAQRAARAREFGEVPFLNGGLFSPTMLEQRRRALRFADDAIASLVGDLLDRYRFTAHEDSHRWSEAAVDPEMLGRAFECLMAPDERHRSGSYYTPPTLVETVVHDALHAAIPDLPLEVLRDADAPFALDDRARAALTALRVLDPACGSGAFLVHTLETMASLMTRAGDRRPVHTVRREVLTRSIFGVDRNPMAVWLCELRLWLSIVIECPEMHIARIPPLPNLDHHIRLGDTLAGGDFVFAPPSARRLTTLRDRYARATGARKHTLASALDREERTRAIAESQRMADRVRHARQSTLEALRARDLFGQRTPRTRADTLRLDRLRQRSRELDQAKRRLELGGALPFRFAAQFADVAATGGFGLVIGNPPWVRPHALPLAERTRLRSEFRSLRQAAWRSGAKRAGAATGFAAQADLAAAFVERSVQLLAPEGIAALLVPAKLWRALSGGGIRHWLDEHTHLRTIRDWSDAPALFDAAVYPSLVVAARRDTRPRAQTSNAVESPIAVSVARASAQSAFSIPPDRLSLDGDPSAPWLLMPTRVRDAFEALRLAGPALGDSPLGRPTLGVKCGCNAAFLVHAIEHDDDTATIMTDGRRATIDRRLLRPVVRGETVFPMADRLARPQQQADVRIVWTHDAAGAPLRTLPASASRWLAHWRPQLERRRDARVRLPWWSLFRTDAAQYDAPRVVWADIGRQLRPRILEAGDPTVPLNTCYVMRTSSREDALALRALLASPIAQAWFSALAEPARGGFRRFMGWTVATLPIPADWSTARSSLADLSLDTKRVADTQATADVVARIAACYHLPYRTLIPLIRWYQP